jgi:adenylate kinase
VYIFAAAQTKLPTQKSNLTHYTQHCMLNLILFGPPGSGKGTQALSLVKKYRLVHISTGDLFRYEMSNDTPLGKQAKEFMAKGQLVPDSVTIGMLQNKVEVHPEAEGFIFDGFPRTIAQAEALDAFLKTKKAKIAALVALDVPEDEIVKRIKQRGLSSGRPDDNDETIIRNRIKIYEQETMPVFAYYQKKNLSHKLNGVGTLLAIFRRICKVVSPLV